MLSLVNPNTINPADAIKPIMKSVTLIPLVSGIGELVITTVLVFLPFLSIVNVITSSLNPYPFGDWVSIKVYVPSFKLAIKCGFYALLLKKWRLWVLVLIYF